MPKTTEISSDALERLADEAATAFIKSYNFLNYGNHRRDLDPVAAIPLAVVILDAMRKARKGIKQEARNFEGALDIAMRERNDLFGERRRLETQLAEARKDTRRLDAIFSRKSIRFDRGDSLMMHSVMLPKSGTLREGIDALYDPHDTE